MERKRPKNEQGQPNNEKEMLLKALVLIERELEACDEREGQTRVVQNIRKILKQVREGAQCGNTRGADVEKTCHESQKELHVELRVEIPLVPPSSAAKALQIAVVVRQVLSNLGSSSVLSSRLVCKIWEDEATRQLLTKRHENMFKIRFEWCRQEGKYLHKNKKTLQDFPETCGDESRASPNARKFLCSQTKIVFQGGDLRSTREYFFNNFGVFVRFLSLKPDTSVETRVEIDEFKSTLHSILMDLTPNLESLTFKTLWTFEQDSRTNQNPTVEWENYGVSTGLEKLKVLKVTYFAKGRVGMFHRIHFQHQNDLRELRERLQIALGNPGPDADTNPSNVIIRKILERARNLQLILDPDFVHTRQIVAARKFQLIKSLDLKFPPNDPNLFLEFEAANPKLTSLKLIKNDGPTRNSSAQESAALSSILQSSQSTLEYFDGVYHLKNLSGIQLPVFPLVKKLGLTQRFVNSDSPRIDGRILPPGFDFDHVFPNLVSLQFDLLQEGKSNPFNFDGNANTNASSSLESLEFAVNRDFNPLWMENISSLYPNLSSLHVKISDKFALFPLACKSIWSFLTQLTNLHLTVELDPQPQTKQLENGGKETEENEETNFIDEMDSIFTGFSVELCRKLKQEDSTLPMRDDAFYANLRESPSILDMKRLTELTISCVKICPEELWSRVTEIHAFERIKQRQNVKFQVTQRV